MIYCRKCYWSERRVLNNRGTLPNGNYTTANLNIMSFQKSSHLKLTYMVGARFLKVFKSLTEGFRYLISFKNMTLRLVKPIIVIILLALSTSTLLTNCLITFWFYQFCHHLLFSIRNCYSSLSIKHSSFFQVVGYLTPFSLSELLLLCETQLVTAKTQD